MPPLRPKSVSRNGHNGCRQQDPPPSAGQRDHLTALVNNHGRLALLLPIDERFCTATYPVSVWLVVTWPPLMTSITDPRPSVLTSPGGHPTGQIGLECRPVGPSP